MKTFLLIAASLFALGCASQPTIVHNRGNDPQVAIDHYKAEKNSIQPEIERIIRTNRIKQGQVTLLWTVDEKGRVKTAEITSDDIRNPELNALLLTHLRGLTFPKTPMFMTSSVEYTYHFGTQNR